MDKVQELAHPALRRLSVFFVGVVVAVGLLATVGTMTGAGHGLRAEGSGGGVVTLAGNSGTRH